MVSTPACLNSARNVSRRDGCTQIAVNERFDTLFSTRISLKVAFLVNGQERGKKDTVENDSGVMLPYLEPVNIG